MRTLDEVIERMEGIYGNISDRTKNDAVHYLKEYRERLSQLQDMMDRYEINDRNYQEAVRNCEMVQLKYQQLLDDYNDNPALTWKQLKQMTGKPVWVEALLYKQWAVIAYVGDDHIRFEGVNLYAPESRFYMGKDNGWQAYRKERS